ncbi:hypothetical protein ACGFIG_09420 [Micromonospora sp. NPDC049048]|uniref:hypothetical protein n=1 Tax=Micromonospora sp. NPDC049048 TaxID=3364263 RepID=UPI003711B075
MARIRTIKPEFFTSLTVASLPVEARLTFIGLWTHVDDEGRCVDDARLIKAAVWPLDDRLSTDVELDLKRLSESSLIVRYNVGERSYLAVRGWSEHQRINRPTRSKLPAPPESGSADQSPGRSHDGPPPPAETYITDDFTDDSLNPHGTFPDDSRQERNREQGTGNREEERPTPPAPDDDRPDVEQICKHLADRIEANGSKRPAIGKTWRDAARRLIDLDDRSVDQIIRCIDWCQDDPFWRSNVLSMPKLREKYDQLRLAAQRDTARSANRTTGANRHHDTRPDQNPFRTGEAVATYASQSTGGTR